MNYYNLDVLSRLQKHEKRKGTHFLIQIGIAYAKHTEIDIYMEI
jgi:hypothetical protein